jgi:hypothetical protein
VPLGRWNSSPSSAGDRIPLCQRFRSRVASCGLAGALSCNPVARGLSIVGLVTSDAHPLGAVADSGSVVFE